MLNLTEVLTKGTKNVATDDYSYSLIDKNFLLELLNNAVYVSEEGTPFKLNEFEIMSLYDELALFFVKHAIRGVLDIKIDQTTASLAGEHIKLLMSYILYGVHYAQYDEVINKKIDKPNTFLITDFIISFNQCGPLMKYILRPIFIKLKSSI